MKFDRKLWMQIHLYLSLFFLPVAFIYALTGALYLFDLREEVGAKVYEIKLDSMPEKGQEKAFIIQTLEANQLPVPKNTDVRIQKGNLVMGSLTYSVSLSSNKQGEPQLRAVDRSLYGILLLMHKAKGSKYEIGSFKLGLFDFIAIGFAFSLIIFYFSGLVITSFCKKNRTNALGVFIGGFLITSLAIYLSI